MKPVIQPDSIDGELLDAVQLNLIPGIGPRLQQLLLSRFESAGGVLSAPADQLRQVPGMGPKLVQSILEHRNRSAAEREIASCRQAGVAMILRGTVGYPRRLEETCDPPGVLYCRGRLEERDGLSVAIVGSRRCSLYGRQQAERLAGGLAQAGMTIVSGMARGIDASAHRGALEAGGRTIAVAATGLAHVYPPEHRELAAEIAAQGAVVSESNLQQRALPGLFPQRNRIISGLSMGVILVEATRNSGALHTARHAMEQGREVFAVPGRVDSEVSAGCLDLIRDGATLVRHVDDVLESLGPLSQPVRQDGGGEVHTPRELSLSDQEREILNLVSVEPRHLDELVQAAGIEASRVMATLTVLEVKRLVRRLPGGYLVRGV